MDHIRGDITPVSMEMNTWKRSISQKPAGETGRKKKPTERTASRALTPMKVVFLPRREAMGTVMATPAILATSPTLRNRPE